MTEQLHIIQSGDQVLYWDHSEQLFYRAVLIWHSNSVPLVGDLVVYERESNISSLKWEEVPGKTIRGVEFSPLGPSVERSCWFYEPQQKPANSKQVVMGQLSINVEELADRLLPLVLHRLRDQVTKLVQAELRSHLSNGRINHLG